VDVGALVAVGVVVGSVGRVAVGAGVEVASCSPAGSGVGVMMTGVCVGSGSSLTLQPVAIPALSAPTNMKRSSC
jgi:hypothetical protein